MVKVSLTRDLSKDLAAASRQVPFAAARALTATAHAARSDLRGEMMRVFDAPTPYTLGSVGVQAARKSDLQAAVFLKEAGAQGRPASRYLEPQIEGGARKAKAFESAIRFSTPAAGTLYAVPGAGLRVDRHGNVTRAQVRKILGGLKQGRGSRLFVGSPKGKPRGVWERGAGKSKKVKPLMIFVDQPRYKQRLDFEGVVFGTVRRRWADELKKALEAALRTAR